MMKQFSSRSRISTALLTGIVAETDRFSNDKTTSVTMSVSATLMKAGANQQLVASKLDEQIDLRDIGLNDLSSDGSASDATVPAGKDDGTIRIDHEEVSEKEPDEQTSDENKKADSDNKQPEPPLTDTQNTNQEENASKIEKHPASSMTSGAKLITEPPTFSSALTANAKPEAEVLDPKSDPLTNSPTADNLPNETREKDNIKAKDISPIGSQPMPPQPVPPQPLTPPPSNWTPPTPPSQPMPPMPPTTPVAAQPINNPANNIKVDDNGIISTLEDLEESVDSPHLKEPMVAEARTEVNKAYNENPSNNSEVLPPIDSLNAQQLGNDLHPQDQTVSGSASAPPPVPPPIPFQFGNQPPPQ